MKTEIHFEDPSGQKGSLNGVMMVYVLQKMPEIAAQDPGGNGTEARPWRMETVNQWAGAAQQKIASRPSGKPVGMSATEVLKAMESYKPRGDLYIIGGQLIERNPSTGGFANYTSDVVEAVPMISQTGTKPKFGTTDMGRPRYFPSPDRSDKIPVYTSKYGRIAKTMTLLSITDKKLAQQGRALLNGAQSLTIAPNEELPGTIAALFIAEVSREKRMLPIGLMLLDLIEVGARYGAGSNKGYTFEALLAGKSASPDGTIDRSTGGKHPMCHDSSISQANTMFESFNPVTQKSVSVLVAWLSLYLRQRPSDWRISGVGRTADVKFNTKRLKQEEENVAKTIAAASAKGMFYEKAVKEALQKRCDTLDCLLDPAKETVIQYVSQN
jgi:hypothetical protein